MKSLNLKKTTYFLILTGLSSIFNCQSKDSETGYPIIEKERIVIVEPYFTECNCLIEKKCLIVNGHASCEKIRGFDHEEGFWVKMAVDVLERPSNTQDVGKLGYIFRKQIKKLDTKSSFPLKELCEFYEGFWDDRRWQFCKIENPFLQKKYCEHTSPKSAGSCEE